MLTPEIPESRHLHPSEDERYTLAYIHRESAIILRYIKRGKHHVFCDLKIFTTEMDERILKRWGLK